MNNYEQIRYKLYRKVNGVKFGSAYSGVPYFKHEDTRFPTTKHSDLFEPGEIYYGDKDMSVIFEQDFI